MKELSKQELMEIEGGCWWLLGFIAGGLAYDIMSNPSESANAVEKGFYKAW